MQAVEYIAYGQTSAHCKQERKDKEQEPRWVEGKKGYQGFCRQGKYW